MLSFFYVIQFIVAILLIVVVIFQKSEGGTSLVSTNVYNSMFSSKSFVSNPLTKITVILGMLLFINSIIIGAIHINERSKDGELLEKIQQLQSEQENASSTDIIDDTTEEEGVTSNVPLGNQ